MTKAKTNGNGATVSGDLLARLNHCPPFMVYYGSRLITDANLSVQELAARSGLSPRTILRTAHRTSWDGVKVGVMDRFCRACGIDPMKPEVLAEVFRREIELEKPFEDLPPHRRVAMVRMFNLLCAESEMAKANPA